MGHCFRWLPTRLSAGLTPFPHPPGAPHDAHRNAPRYSSLMYEALSSAVRVPLLWLRRSSLPLEMEDRSEELSAASRAAPSEAGSEGEISRSPPCMAGQKAGGEEGGGQ